MLEKLWARIRAYFYYNKIERDGMLAFAFLLLLFFSGMYIYEHNFVRKVDRTAFLSKVDSIKKMIHSKESEASYFMFNPNRVDSVSLLRLGFSVRQIRNFQNYRKAGGIFYKKEDFRKLYFVNDSIYKVYASYIRINKQQVKKSVASRQKPVPNMTRVESKKKQRLFVFNPNKLDKKAWLELGVPEELANRIRRYLSKGGHFYQREDLKKIYGLSDSLYKRIEPFVRIPEEIAERVDIYDLNSLEKSDLEKMHIKKSIARRLLKFRKKLGGYAKLSQLAEIYNIDEYSLTILRKHTKIETKVVQININTAKTEELSRHPYLSFHEAEAIVRYRERKGNYATVESLKTHKILTDKVFQKVNFYLKVKK